MKQHVGNDKRTLRQYLKRIQIAVTEKQKRKWSQEIVGHILAGSLYEKSRSIGLFIPLPDEPDIWPVIRDAWKKKKIVAVPRIEQKELDFRKIVSEKDLEIGPFGIHQPKVTIPPIAVSPLDLFIVPGYAFDTKGNRLGRGGGYYDKLLLKTNIPTIGVCFGFRVVESVPHDMHDMKVHQIVTEDGVSIL